MGGYRTDVSGFRNGYKMRLQRLEGVTHAATSSDLGVRAGSASSASCRAPRALPGPANGGR